MGIVVNKLMPDHHHHKEINIFHQLMPTGEKVRHHLLYSPFNCEIVSNTKNYKLVKCSISDLNNNIFTMHNYIKDRFTNDKNPFQMVIHYIEQDDKKKGEQKFFKLTPIHDHLTFYTDYLEKSLEDILHQNHKLKLTFEESDLWRLVDCISFCMYEFQKKNIYCGVIGIKKIFEVDTPLRKRVFKIVESLVPNTKRHKVKNWKKHYAESQQLHYSQFRNSPPSPNELQQILQQDPHEVNAKVNFFKNDVFSFGIVLLQCIHGASVVEDIYDNKSLTFKKNGEIYELETFIQDAPFSMQELLKLMLEVNDEKRADWVKIQSMIDEQPEYRLLEQHASTDFIYSQRFVEEEEQAVFLNDYFIDLFETRGLNFGTGKIENDIFDSTYQQLQSQIVQEEQKEELQEVKQAQEEKVLLTKVQEEAEKEALQKKRTQYEKELTEQFISNLKKQQQQSQQYQNIYHNNERLPTSQFYKQISQIQSDPNYENEVQESLLSVSNNKSKFTLQQSSIYRQEIAQENLAVIEFKNHQRYKGQIQEQKKKGYGQQYDENNKLIQEGNFGEIDGPVLIYNPSGEENLTNPNFICEHFDIEMKKKNWIRFEGFLQNKKKIQQGKITFTDGSVFEGNFKDDKANGEGLFTYAAINDNPPVQIKGVWENNIFKKKN